MNNPLKKTTFCTVILVMFIINIGHTQNQVFSQFAVNPYQFNPSFAASNGYAEANIFFRKQWVGIENAPEALALNIQSPVGRNVSLGVNVVSSKTILLNYTQALATFAYKVRFNYNHHLNFGISAGIGMNNFDIEAIAGSNDPALANVLQKSNHLAGQFGFNYQLRNLNIGFALPTLLESRVNSSDSFQETKFNVFDTKFGSIAYTIDLRNIQLTPAVLYRAIDNAQDQWEGQLIATYNKFMWIGASYRTGYGVTGFIGFRLKGNYRVGYAYEYPTNSISKASQGSHEFYLGARLGNKNRDEEIYAQQLKRDSINHARELAKEQEVLAEETLVAPEIETREPVNPIPQKETAIVDTPEQAVAVEPEAVEEIKIKPGFYLVVGAYRVPENALRNLTYLKNNGYKDADMIYIEQKDFFYVYLLHSTERTTIVEELDKAKSRNRFFGAWIFIAN